jgi:hypothetical protein
MAPKRAMPHSTADAVEPGQTPVDFLLHQRITLDITIDML